MIITENISKSFGDIKAVDGISATIKKASVFGLVGTNGAGKSTFLKMLAGIYKQDSGVITIDGEPVYENMAVKNRIYYISDDQHFFANTTPKEMAQYYGKIYNRFDQAKFDQLLKSFDLDPNRKINTFSKGMKKQVSIICGISAQTDYIFCDETFDGLDPVMRQAVKSLFAADVVERQMTPIIASHNLRELEDICDHVGLLHKGGILVSKDLDDMKLSAHKVQCVFQEGFDIATLAKLNILQNDKRGSLNTMVIKGKQADILSSIQATDPVFMEILPLTLEEIFISETEVAGYDLKKLFI